MENKCIKCGKNLLEELYSFDNLCEDCYHDEMEKEKINKSKEVKSIESEEMEDKEVIYEIKGIGGKSIKVYKDKAIINVKDGIASFLVGNLTNGEKIIYYKDVIGIQFRKCGAILRGYLQLETASASLNNKSYNFSNENSFAFETSTVSNEKMEEVFNYVKKQVEIYKNIETVQVNSFSNADEIKKYKELLDMGAITQEEFERKKQELLK